MYIPNSVPSIAISYNGIKAKGSFEHWGLEDFVVEPKNISTIHNKVKYIEDNYNTIENTINKNKSKVYGLIKEAYDKLI